MSSEVFFNELAKALFDRDEEKAMATAKKIVESKISAVDAIKNGISVGLKRIGEEFEAGNYPLPYILIAAEVAGKASDYLKQYIPKSEIKEPRKLLIGVVKGDVHDIGAKIVSMIFEASGFKVLNIGKDVTNEKFLQEAEKFGADIIGLSAFMTSTMVEQKLFVEMLKSKGLRDKYKIMVGGGVINQNWAEIAGADGYGGDATEALNVATKLLKMD